MKEYPVNSFAHIRQLIFGFWKTSASNSLHLDPDEVAWDEPLVAIAAGDDPFFKQLKNDIGSFYWTPEEAFHMAYPQTAVPASELRIISYALPQTLATREEQRRETHLPAERWARSRYFGEQFNCDLRFYLAETLTEAGFPAVAPERLPDFDYRQSERLGIASNWSERHTAFVAGLGTFGLSDGLITSHGKAVRFGSVVAKIDLPVTPRPYGNDHQAWCLWYAHGTCGICVKRCPTQAITTEHGHDKKACRSYIREVTAPFATKNFGTGATPCGLCQVKIPCESRSPLS